MLKVKWPDVIDWPFWEDRRLFDPRARGEDPRRFRVFFRFRIPNDYPGYYRWAVRLFGYEVAWVNRGDLGENYAMLVKVGRYDPEHEHHWPRPKAVRAAMGGYWWEPW